MKYAIYAVAATLLLTGNAAAQEVVEPEAPEYITRVFERDRDSAADNFAKQMLEVDPDGNLSEEAITKHGLRTRAVVRAAEMKKFLVHDINLDGVLSPEEITDLKRFNKTARRRDTQIVFRVLKADVNSDGQLSFQEMADVVVSETKDLSKYMRRTKDLSALLFFDQNKNGIVTLEEMLLGVQKLSVPCDC